MNQFTVNSIGKLDAAGRQKLSYLIARSTIAFVWMYHGVVPKLIFKHPDEAFPLISVGLSSSHAWTLVNIAAGSEIVMSVATIIFWKSKVPLLLTCCAMIAALLGVAFTAPQLLYAAFNPVTTSIMLFVLSVVALLTRQR